MTWEEIIYQARPIAALKAAIDTNRIAHAYLFHGPEGSGKKAVAFAFAKALLCQNTTTSAPCNSCDGCSKVSRLIHPDLQLILPYPGEPSLSEITERFSLLAEDPYAPVDFVASPNSIGAEKQSTNKQVTVIRDRISTELIRPASFKAVEGGYKVAILTDFDYVKPSGANAVLKLLEEPPGKTVFILTTKRADRLLPTIVSRCQKVNFDRLPTAHIAAALSERFELEPDKLDAISRMADGSMTRAIQIAGNQELLGLRSMVFDYFRSSLVGDVEGIHRLSQLFSGGGREQVKSVLTVMIALLRDLVLYRASDDLSRVVNLDHAETVQKFVSNLPNANLPMMVSAVEDAIRLVQRNVNTTVLLIALSHKLADLMRGIGDGELYQPLAN